MKKKRYTKPRYCKVLLCCRSEDALKHIEKYKGEILYQSRIFPYIGIKIRRDYINKLKKCSGIDAVHIDRRMKFIPKNNRVQAKTEISPWNIRRIFETRRRINYGTNVRVAVLDTGIDLNHQDLLGNIGGGINFVNPGQSFQDDEGHGTFVSGIIAAVDNTADMIGVAPKAKIFGVKVLDRTGNGSFVSIIQGIEWAIENDMHIINMSLGTTYDFPPFGEAVAEAIKRGILVVAAAGNSGNAAGTGDTVGYPARYPYVIGVAALTRDNKRASFSSTGTRVDISAPGEDVTSLALGGGLSKGSGTSFSAPHVTGLLATYRRARPRATAKELRSLLFTRAKQLASVNKSRLTGYGLAQE